jgi:hypothetical protein
LDFVSSLYTTVTSTASASAASLYTIIQSVEGNNLTDLSWGTANAKTITVSFQVRSNVTGTYGVFIRNGAANRYYVSTFSISSANTWEEKTITIPGDTSGTWLTTTGVGLTLGVVLGAGADRHGTANTGVSGSSSGPFTTPSQVDWMSNSGATFFITGVQLEKGTVATPFERRPFGMELALCQRYFQTTHASSLNGNIGLLAAGTSFAIGAISWKVSMRSAPTTTVRADGAAANGTVRRSSNGVSVGTTGTLNTNVGTEGAGFLFTGSVLTVGEMFDFQYTASAEL